MTSEINNVFINCKFNGLMNFDCVECDDTVYIPITAEEDEEYRCDTCGYTYKPREGLKYHLDNIPSKEDVIENDMDEQRSDLEDDELDYSITDYNEDLKKQYNKEDINELVGFCNYKISGGATFKKGSKVLTLHYGGGSSRITGIKNIEDARDIAESVAETLVDGEVVEISEPQSYNVTKVMDHGLSLRQLLPKIKEKDEIYSVKYNPDIYPAMILDYLHGYNVYVNDNKKDDELYETEYNISINNEFVFSVSFDDGITDEKQLSNIEKRDGYDVNLNIDGIDDVSVKVNVNSIELITDDETHVVEYKEKKNSMEFICESLDIEIKIKRLLDNMLLYSTKNVVINGSKLEYINKAYDDLYSFIKDKSTGVSNDRYLFEEQNNDNEKLRKELANLPLDPESDDEEDK